MNFPTAEELIAISNRPSLLSSASSTGVVEEEEEEDEEEEEEEEEDDLDDGNAALAVASRTRGASSAKVTPISSSHGATYAKLVEGNGGFAATRGKSGYYYVYMNRQSTKCFGLISGHRYLLPLLTYLLTYSLT